MNPFEVLGLSQSATLEDVKKAWRQKAHLHHPDKGGDAKAFAQCREAYSMLDSEEKLSYYRNVGVRAFGLEELLRQNQSVYDAVRAAMANRGMHFSSTTEDTDPFGLYEDILK